MPGTESTDRAGVRDRRAKPSPGSEVRADNPKRPLSEVLLSAIADSGLAPHSLGRASDVPDSCIRSFVSRESDLQLASAEKLAVALGLKLVREAQGPGSEARANDPTRPLSDVILSAIADSGQTAHALAKRAGVHAHTVRYFVARKGSLFLASADKLAVALGLKMVREAKHQIPRPKPPPRSMADVILSAIADSGMNNYRIARASGLDFLSVSFFVARKRSISLASAEKLAVALGLKLVREAQGPGSEARANDPTRPLSDVILSAIADSGQTAHALAKRAGVQPSTISFFVARKRSISLASAEKLAVALGLKMVREAKHLIPQKPPFISTPQPFLADLRSAIADSGQTAHALGKRAGLASITIRNFVDGRVVITFSTAKKLADVLGLKLEPAKILAQSDAPPPSTVEEVPFQLTKSQSKVIEALKAAGMDGLKGAELRVISDVTTWWRTLKSLKSHPEHGPKIHFPSDGKTHYKYY